ncbi:hypothetical protein [Poseidonibacter antarcticus]|uniref:hypothetical protein n=1 Tax=Poseidonibacter antarcticus TaxID=2478538 RepID=UPI000EF51D4A|nr:hypothetical protein [Poseidonibacter antarcticus]
MRLLFIYFYKDFGTFEKGSIIHLSKKYKFSFDEQKSKENEFYFKKIKNDEFLEDFYSSTIDIGLLIGENGTGKSVLLNSIRDKENDYSICVYEVNNTFYMIESNLFEIKNNIPFKKDDSLIVKIDDKKIDKKREFKSIYYSSLLEKTNTNLNDDYDISEIKLLNEINDNNLDDKINQLEIYDLYKMKEFGYSIKTDLSETFFEDAKEMLKNSYINLFEKVIEICKRDKKYDDFEIFFNEIPEFIIEDIRKYFFKENDVFINDIKNDSSLVNTYLNEYENDIDIFFKKNKINKDEALKSLDKLIDDKKESIFNSTFFKNLNEINFDIKTPDLENILKKLRSLFPNDLYQETINVRELENLRISEYFYVKKLFNKCIEILKSMNESVDDKRMFFDLYQLIYLKNEMKVSDFIIKDFIKKNKIKDLLLLDKKVTHLSLSSEGKKHTDYKEKTIREIKNIIETNYSLFYNLLANDLENLDDKIFKLLVIKRMEKFKKNDNLKDRDKILTRYRTIYCYLTKFLKLKNIDSKEKKELYKTLFIKNNRPKGIDLEFSLKVIYNRYISENESPLENKENPNMDKYYKFIENSVNPFAFTYDPPISSGQKAKDIINARINNAIGKIKEKNSNENILILLDEADLKLHLEWQRKFVFELIQFLNKYTNNKFYILYATHSPMILSDITSDRVVFLEKEENDKFSKDKQEFDDKNKLKIKSTFGANIYDIYNDSFFVDDFMGEFAQTKIKEVIGLIKQYKIEKKNISSEEILKAKKIISNIGEPLLKNKLEDEIKSLFEDDIDISIIVKTLKNKSFEEIKEELNKYSKDKQNKILEQLFGNQNDKS